MKYLVDEGHETFDDETDVISGGYMLPDGTKCYVNEDEVNSVEGTEDIEVPLVEPTAHDKKVARNLIKGCTLLARCGTPTENKGIADRTILGLMLEDDEESGDNLLDYEFGFFELNGGE
ncbi:MAG: hypothetical protein KKC38_02170 [Nanoarchaeota archaeon]|nr:hypothetical protein [Nanoarchaeota archaeon]